MGCLQTRAECIPLPSLPKFPWPLLDLLSASGAPVNVKTRLEAPRKLFKRIGQRLGLLESCVKQNQAGGIHAAVAADSWQGAKLYLTAVTGTRGFTTSLCVQVECRT